MERDTCPRCQNSHCKATPKRQVQSECSASDLMMSPVNVGCVWITQESHLLTVRDFAGDPLLRPVGAPPLCLVLPAAFHSPPSAVWKPRILSFHHLRHSPAPSAPAMLSPSSWCSWAHTGPWKPHLSALAGTHPSCVYSVSALSYLDTVPVLPSYMLGFLPPCRGLRV